MIAKQPRSSTSKAIFTALLAVLALAVAALVFAPSSVPGSVSTQDGSRQQAHTEQRHGDHGSKANEQSAAPRSASGLQKAKEQRPGQVGAGGASHKGNDAGGPVAGTGLELAPGRQLMPPPDKAERPPQSPANTKQKSLAQAAGQRPAPGKGAPAAAAKNPTANLIERGRVNPSEVLGDASSSLGGCLAEYGRNGQCMPVVPPSMSKHVEQMRQAGLDPASMDHSWSCSEVREYFPDGITVRTSKDPQGLDSNDDGLACGRGDS